MYSDQRSQSVKDDDGLHSAASTFASLWYHVWCKYDHYQHFFAMAGDEHIGRAIPVLCSGTRDTPATYVVSHGCTDADMTAAATTTSHWLSSVARAALHFSRGRAGSTPSHLSWVDRNSYDIRSDSVCVSVSVVQDCRRLYSANSWDLRTTSHDRAA